MSTAKHLVITERTGTHLEVMTADDKPGIIVSDNGIARLCYFKPKDAPALALAILEAAGIVPTHHSSYQNGTAEALELVAQSLKDEVGIEAAKAKEAAALEKLTKRRNEVMNELRGDSTGSYDRCTTQFQRAIDRIIELEDKAQSSGD